MKLYSFHFLLTSWLSPSPAGKELCQNTVLQPFAIPLKSDVKVCQVAKLLSYFGKETQVIHQYFGKTISYYTKILVQKVMLSKKKIKQNDKKP